MIYTDKTRPKPKAAARAWDFFKAKYGRFIEIFFSPKADFGDARGAGWTGYISEGSCVTPYGAKSADFFVVHSVEEIDEWHWQAEGK